MVKRTESEGFMDSQSEFYDGDEREERWYQSSIWVVLTVICSVLFLFVAWLNIKEIMLKANGKKITAPYLPYSDSLSIKAEDGKPYVIDFGGQFPSHREYEIDLYYYDNIAEAKPLTILEFWIITELFFGCLTVVCFCKARKNLLRTHHHYGAS